MANSQIDSWLYLSCRLRYGVFPLGLALALDHQEQSQREIDGKVSGCHSDLDSYRLFFFSRNTLVSPSDTEATIGSTPSSDSSSACRPMES